MDISEGAVYIESDRTPVAALAKNLISYKNGVYVPVDAGKYAFDTKITLVIRPLGNKKSLEEVLNPSAKLTSNSENGDFLG